MVLLLLIPKRRLSIESSDKEHISLGISYSFVSIKGVGF